MMNKLRFTTGNDKKILIDRDVLLKKYNTLPYIYIRIPRTGSTSISKALCSDEPWPHFHAALVKNLLGQENYNKKFVFTSVRNPWDRLVSWYHFNCDDYRADEEQKKIYKSLGFKGWIMNSCPHSGWKPHHLAHQPKNPISQICWIKDEQENIIVDNIIRLENLQEDLFRIKNSLKLNTVSVSKLNVSSKRKEKNYKKYYDSETKNMVYKLFQEDIEFFKYSF